MGFNCELQTLYVVVGVAAGSAAVNGISWLIMGRTRMMEPRVGWRSTQGQENAQQNSFEILLLSTKTIKSVSALMCGAALQVRRKSVSLS